MSTFKEFIVSLFKKAKLSQKHIDLYTDDRSMMLYQTAFTHKSYDRLNNYEFLELSGDTIVNFAIAQYIQERFPKINSTKWLTKIKHNLSSKRYLAELSEKGGFLKYIRYGREMENLIQNINKRRYDDKYLSMMEDVFEAIIGAFVKVINLKTVRGVGYAVVYMIVKSFYDEVYISLKVEDVFDNKSRLKELFDSLLWKINENMKTYFDKDQKKYITTVFGFPKGDKTPIEENKVVLSTGYGPNSKISQDFASRFALKTLKDRYNIQQEWLNPYIDISEKEFIKPKKSFKKFIISLMRRAKINSKSIQDFTDPDSMNIFLSSFVDRSHNPFINYDLNKFQGVTLIDMTVIEYLETKYPKIQSEKWITNIKHNIISKGTIFKIAENEGFVKYIYYGDKITESLKETPNIFDNKDYQIMLDSVFRAFLGALVKVIDKKRNRGVGYYMVYNLLESYLDSIEIKTESYQDVINPKTRLKELYDRYKWALDKNIIEEVDEKKTKYTIQIIGYPFGNKAPVPQNRTILAKAEGKTSIEAQQKASEKALDVLKTRYRIYE